MCDPCANAGKGHETNDPCASDEMKKIPIGTACGTCLPQKRNADVCTCGDNDKKNDGNKKTIVTEICISCGGEIRRVPLQEICIESKTPADNKDSLKDLCAETKEKSEEKEKKSPADKTKEFETLPCDLKRCKSRELRGGVYFISCDCVKRNGLQDDCRRTCCQGSSDCKTQPDAKCCPSQFSRKYIQMSMGLRKPEKPGKFSP